nr:reverse transcriptase domain, reverse transcriptase zinc-binding domain protein [Tanacetum cinerariifolium]
SSLNDSEDVWIWSSGNNHFSVKDARCHIDEAFLPDNGYETRWNRFLPKKINIFIWRTLHVRLPSRWNLSQKGIEVPTIICPLCNNGVDNSYHTMWVCSLATTLEDLQMSSKKKDIIESIDEGPFQMGTVRETLAEGTEGAPYLVQASNLNVNKMGSADNTSGLALQRKERCTLQYALSLEEEKSSCLRPFSSTSFMLFHARSVIK